MSEAGVEGSSLCASVHLPVQWVMIAPNAHSCLEAEVSSSMQWALTWAGRSSHAACSDRPCCFGRSLSLLPLGGTPGHQTTGVLAAFISPGVGAALLQLSLSPH